MLVVSYVALAAIFIGTRIASRSSYSYRQVYWFFEAAHFLAGFFLGMFFANFFTQSWEIIVAVFIIGAGWELTEVIMWKVPRLRRTFLKKGTITLPDTLLDLSLDILGVLLFVFLY